MALSRARCSREASLNCAAERALAETGSLQILACAGGGADAATHAASATVARAGSIRIVVSPVRSGLRRQHPGAQQHRADGLALGRDLDVLALGPAPGE